PQRIELLEHRFELSVDRANAVDVKIIEAAPALSFGWYAAEHIAPHVLEFSVRLGAARRVEGLFEAFRHRHVPVDLVELIVWRDGGVAELDTGILPPLPGRVGVEIHDVVRVDQADKERPWLSFGTHRLGLAAKPRDSTPCDQMIELVPAKRVP